MIHSENGQKEENYRNRERISSKNGKPGIKDTQRERNDKCQTDTYSKNGKTDAKDMQREQK